MTVAAQEILRWLDAWRNGGQLTPAIAANLKGAVAAWSLDGG